MSEHNVNLIAASIRARIPSIRTEDDGLEILRDLVTQLARNTADHAFWTVKNKGLSYAQADALSERLVKEHTIAITDTIHHFGGGLNTALDLTEKWVVTYGGRLKDLHASPKQGGRA